MDAALGRRDRVFAAVAEREARRGRRVLLLSGFLHLARVAPALFGGENALRLLERRVPGRIWVVLPYWGGRARGQSDFERRCVTRWPPIAVRALAGPLGAEPADRILPESLPPQPRDDQPASPFPGLELRAIGDALMSFGPCSRLRTARFSLAQYRDPAYRAELDRRSRILTGTRFVLPPAELSDAPYCPTVTGQ
jgi:hypothetical protein